MNHIIRTWFTLSIIRPRYEFVGFDEPRYNFVYPKFNFVHTFMEYFGNKEILKNYKIGFLCSRKVPANTILKTYDWAIEKRGMLTQIIKPFQDKIISLNNSQIRS